MILIGVHSSMHPNQGHVTTTIYMCMYASRVFWCLQAYRRGLWYPKYHFLLMGQSRFEWWKDETALEKYNCTVEQMEQVTYSVYTCI